MNKHGVLLAFSILLGPWAWAQTFVSKSSEVSFFSKTPVEDIQAVTKDATCALKGSTGELLARVPIAKFKFPNSLMQEHFNENYLESDKYPNSTWKGKLDQAVDYSKPGKYNVSATGTLDIHGVAKPSTLKGTLEVLANGGVVLNATFDVLLVDHNIERPQVVLMKIAEKINVKSQFTLAPAEKK